MPMWRVGVRYDSLEPGLALDYGGNAAFLAYSTRSVRSGRR